MEKYKCIYCLNQKPRSEFNREHVISRFMGTYENAYVLGKQQVCKACNSFFCNNIENVVSFDSLEGLLRIKHRPISIHTGRAIGRTRLKIKGRNDIFDGLTMFISSDPESQSNLKIEIAPAVGIILDDKARKYEYFSIDSIPEHDDAIRKRLQSSKQPFVIFAYDESAVIAALTQKGYDLSRATYISSLSLSDVTSETSLEALINFKVDNILSRLAAKNIFNYLCYAYGKYFVLQSCFDNFRSFIRAGNHNKSIKMLINNGRLWNTPGLVENCHVVGAGWSIIKEQIYLCGFVSWFNSITYIFVLFTVSTVKINCLPPLKVIICDNSQRTITEGEYLIVFHWPDDNKNLDFLMKSSNPFYVKDVITNA